MSSEVSQLKNQLIEERARHLMDMDDAYPDVGMGLSYGVAMATAEQQLGFKYEQIKDIK
jgi:hypothetical protein